MVQFFNPRGSGWVNQPKISERQPLGTACLFHLALVDLCCGHQIHGGTFVEVPARQTSRGTGSSFNKGEDMRKTSQNIMLLVVLLNGILC